MTWRLCQNDKEVLPTITFGFKALGFCRTTSWVQSGNGTVQFRSRLANSGEEVGTAEWLVETTTGSWP